MSGIEKRRHPRHATDLPIAFGLAEVLASESAYINNISAGGVSFDSMVELAAGTVIMLHLPPSKPVVRIPGRVAWCRKMAFQYAVGVEYLIDDPVLRDRIVEMVHQIESYRLEVGRAQRTMTSQQAALEWIRLFGPSYFAKR